MMVEIPKVLIEGGPVVLVCDDDGGLMGGQKVHVALYFPTEAEAVIYKKRLILGKKATMKIYPIEVI